VWALAQSRLLFAVCHQQNHCLFYVQISLPDSVRKYARSKAKEGQKNPFDRIQQRIYKHLLHTAFKPFAQRYSNLIDFVVLLNKLNTSKSWLNRKEMWGRWNFFQSKMLFYGRCC